MIETRRSPGVAADTAIHVGEESEALLRLHRQGLAELVNVAHHLLHGLLVKVQRLGHVVEDADLVNDQAMGLRLAIGAVHASDGLKEVVIFHRLVEIHRLEDRREVITALPAGEDHDQQRFPRAKAK